MTGRRWFGDERGAVVVLFAGVAQTERVTGRVGVDRTASTLRRQSGRAMAHCYSFLSQPVIEADIEVHLGRTTWIRPLRRPIVLHPLRSDHRQAWGLACDHNATFCFSTRFGKSSTAAQNVASRSGSSQSITTRAKTPNRSELAAMPEVSG